MDDDDDGDDDGDDGDEDDEDDGLFSVHHHLIEVK